MGEKCLETKRLMVIEESSAIARIPEPARAAASRSRNDHLKGAQRRSKEGETVNRVACHTLQHFSLRNFPKVATALEWCKNFFSHKDVKTPMIYTCVSNRGGKRRNDGVLFRNHISSRDSRGRLPNTLWIQALCENGRRCLVSLCCVPKV